MNEHTPTTAEIIAAVADVLAEIATMIADGTITGPITTFADVHDHVDANCLGGFCDDANPRSSWALGFVNDVQDAAAVALEALAGEAP